MERQAVGKSNFEYNAAYSNQFDLATAIDNDGADTFFGIQAAGEFDIAFDLACVKQEVMSPAPFTPDHSTANSSSEYMTPYTSNRPSTPPMSDRTIMEEESPLQHCRSLSMSDVSTETFVVTPTAQRAVSVDMLADTPHTPRAGVDGLSVAMRDLRMSAVKRIGNTPARRSVIFEGLPLLLPREKQHTMETRLDSQVNTPVIKLRTRAVTRFSQAADNVEVQEEDEDDEEEEEEAVAVQHTEPEPASCVRRQTFDCEEPMAQSVSEPLSENEDEVPSNIRTVPFDLPSNKSRVVVQPLPEDGASNIRTQPFDRPEKKARIVLPPREEVSSNIRSQPFEGGANQKRKGSPMVGVHTQAAKYISMAEMQRKFLVGTPDRFHSKPRHTDVFKRNRVHQLAQAARNTVPQSPALQSKLRSRPVHHPTREQVEQQEVEEMKSHKVKAMPLNKKVFKTPQLGTRVEKRPMTAVEPFNLTEVKKKELLPCKPTFTFTARPVPKGILDGPTGVKDKQPAKLTDPITPAFVRRRAGTTPHKHTAPVIVYNNGKKSMGTQEVFHFGVRKAGTPGERKLPSQMKVQRTEVVPFSFEQRDVLIQQKKEEKIKQVFEAEKKAREFHANPLPGRSRCSSSNSVNENHPPVLPNQLVMSHLVDDGYLARRMERIKIKEREETEQLKTIAAFKARPATVVHARPFVVKKLESPLVEICPFELNTMRRAHEREEFDRQMADKRQVYEECKREADEERRKREAEQLVQERKQVVHKANPVRHFKPLEIQPSKKMLTNPMSPFVHRATPSKTPRK